MVNDWGDLIVKQFAKFDSACEDELLQLLKTAAKSFHCSSAAISTVKQGKKSLQLAVSWNLMRIEDEQQQFLYQRKRKTTLIIPDMTKDNRFAFPARTSNEKPIRFYAGVPLISRAGEQIGMLCMLDIKPRKLSRAHRLMLGIVARQVLAIMELKLSSDLIHQYIDQLQQEKAYRVQSDLRLRSTFESIADPYFLLGIHEELIDFNRAAETFMKHTFGLQLVSGHLMNAYLSASFRETFTQYYRKAVAGTRTAIEYFSNLEGQKPSWWYLIFEPTRDDKGTIIGVSYVAHNIDERKTYEQEILHQNRLLTRIAEIQAHEYRGPLASILGMLHLIEVEQYQASKEYLMMLKDAANKLDQKIHEVIVLTSDPSLSIQH